MGLRLFILAEPRSGSTWLMETLNSNQDISLIGELYNHVQYEQVKNLWSIPRENFHFCLKYLDDHIVEHEKKKRRFVGCKILLNQLLMFSQEYPRFFLENYRDSHFILLFRQNLVASHMSLRIAHKYNTWHVNNPCDVKKRNITICPKTFLTDMENSRQTRESYRLLLKELGIKTITLNYEMLFKNTEAVTKDLSHFLGFKTLEVRYSREVKGNPFQPEEIIENYHEVEKFLANYPLYLNMLRNVKHINLTI